MKPALQPVLGEFFGVKDHGEWSEHRDRAEEAQDAVNTPVPFHLERESDLSGALFFAFAG